ncbi:MAG TPA: MSMEG_6728 family protein [Acidimicrobiales bacterium]|nr:MSMEG_6728 family protein [Acidimicrobiales bacterium]
MQTFLPFENFRRSAQALDDRRLGKQRVEALQVLRALTRPVYGWKSHPAVLQWKGYEEALVSYTLEVCAEWNRRGFADTVAASITAELSDACGTTIVRSQPDLARAGALPPWLGDDAFHAGHQSALVGKDPAYYREQFPDWPEGLPYYWPVRSEAVVSRERAKAARDAAREGRA